MANGEVGETTQGRTGKWAKRLGAKGNGAKRLRVNGKVGETARIRNAPRHIFSDVKTTSVILE